ncbi:MAG TPA: uracil-DNA glycosylase [Fimbriimonadaceae bacterium]|nr:uracil-DNA glycosylase [Fimbriimonadaceae bacterium]HRJ34159.1 uracil-DNA glycosylase [Fimbriimonadaceae bacterium]
MTPDDLNAKIIGCRRCPRLVEWREQVALEKRKSFADQTYWGRPVPNFGDLRASRLIVGLAPAAHGANRTGRMFTGDRSGDWLYRALHRAGLASQPEATSVHDGLQLIGVAITALVHCAPPDNKPTREEISACQPFLTRSIEMAERKAILCLGSLAWEATLAHFQVRPRIRFGHGVHLPVLGGPQLFASYHPSQQNTFTGRLTEEMLDEVVASFALAGR